MSGGVHHRYSGTITNCVIAFNTVKGSPEPATTSAWSMDASCYQNCCIYPGVPEKFLVANGCVNADPLFADPANGDFRIQEGSACVDAHDGTVSPDIDLYGQPRVTLLPDDEGGETA